MKKPQLLFTGVLGLAINDKREFLVTQRNQPEHSDVHEKWQVPGGGLEFGEQPEETLVRELTEEITVIPTIIYPYPICKTSVWHHHDEDSSATLLCYLVTIGQQQPKIDDPETLDWRWVKKEDLYRLECLPLTEVFIDIAIKICTQYSLWPASSVIK
jgi:8-oxo-dGTP diphosphatase